MCALNDHDLMNVEGGTFGDPPSRCLVLHGHGAFCGAVASASAK